MPVGRARIAAQQRQLPHSVQRPRDREPIANLAFDGQRFLEARCGPRVVAALAGRGGQEIERVPDPGLIVELPRETQALLPKILRLLDVPAVLRALREVKFQGYISIEYEANENNPSPDMQACIDVFKESVRKLG